MAANKLLTTAANMQQLVSGDRSTNIPPLVGGDRSTNTQQLVGGDRSTNTQQLVGGDRSTSTQPLVRGDRNTNTQPLIKGDWNPSTQQMIKGDWNPSTQQMIIGDRNPSTQQMIKSDWNPSTQQMIKGDRIGNTQQLNTQQLIKGDWNDNMQQIIRGGDRNLLMSSDDNVMMRQIQETHSPDGRYMDIKPLLNIIEDILKRATINVVAILPDTPAQIESIEDRTSQATAISMLDALSHIIDRVSCEMQSKCLSGVDGHATTVSLLYLLSNYPWNSKLVLTLAAFALNYGEFWLLAQIYSTNQLARSMAILKQVPVIMEQSGPLKHHFDALNNLIKSVVELTKCIVAFEELPPKYIAHDEPALSTAIATIPTAVYWSMRSIIACAIQITSLSSMGHEHILGSTALNWELSTLSHKINHILEHLKTQMTICLRHIGEKREMETYNLLKELFEMVHIDNMRVLKALIYPKDDLLPLVDGSSTSSNRRVSLDVLRRRNVLLLISGLDMSRDELAILEQIYNESRMHATRMESLYEVVWMPIVDHSVQWTELMEKQFEDLRSTMPWYSVHHPSLISQPVIRFVRERWHFRNKPILVVLDPQGRELSPNAIHMMWIWGSSAFPFTSLREEALWREETWRLELLISGMDPTILSWIKDGKYIFLYGGDDIEWIRKFTTTARAVAQAARIPLEMAYVGKSTKREQVRKAIATITVEKLSYTWQDLTMIWFFWTRIESMLFSKIQLNTAVDHDPMLQEIKKLLSYDKSGGWALFCKGSSVLVRGHAETMQPALTGYDEWKEDIPQKGFDMSFKDYHDRLHMATPPCCRFEFSTAAGRIPNNMRCPECLRVMEKYMTFVCCHDENATTGLY